MKYVGDLYAKIGSGRGHFLKLEMTSTDVDNLVEENRGLKEDLQAKTFAMVMSEKVEKQLRAQIEKMKICGNCKHQYVKTLSAYTDDSDEPCCSCKDHSKWELKD